MCSKCNKAHAAEQSCAIAGARSATQILTDLEGGIRSCVDSVTKLADQVGKMGERLSVVETTGKKRAAGGVSLPGVELEKEQFSFQRLILAISTKRFDLAPFEIEVCRQTNKRAGRDLHEDGSTVPLQRDLSTDLDSAGGYIVPNQFITEMIELLRAKLVTGKLGITRMDGLTGGAVLIPKLTAAATGFWVAENAQITKSQQTVGQVEMRPREAAALTVLSNRLLRLSNPAAEAMIRTDLAAVIDRLVDLAILQGGGGLQPLGISQTPGINTRSVARQLTVDDLYNMVYDIEKSNADKGKLGWCFHPRTWNGLRQLKDGEGRYLLTSANAPGMQASWNPTTSERPAIDGFLLGYPFATTTQIPFNLTGGANASRIYFGNWEDVVLGTWQGMEIMASQETSTAFQQNQTWIRLVMEIDTLLRHGASFCVDSTIL